MPIKSRWSCSIPEVHLATYLFDSPIAPLSTSPLIIEAKAPETHFLTQTTFRLWCQRYAVGLRANGLQKGDRVLLFSGNTCFFPVVIVGTIMAGGIFTGGMSNVVGSTMYALKRESKSDVYAQRTGLPTYGFWSEVFDHQ